MEQLILMGIMNVAKWLNVFWIFSLTFAFCFSSNEGREIAFAAGAAGIGFIQYVLDNWIQELKY